MSRFRAFPYRGSLLRSQTGTVQEVSQSLQPVHTWHPSNACRLTISPATPMESLRMRPSRWPNIFKKQLTFTIPQVAWHVTRMIVTREGS